MKAGYISRVLLLTASSLIAITAQAKPTPPIEIVVEAPLRADGTFVDTAVHARFIEETFAARVKIQGTGVAETSPFVKELPGPWLPGAEYVLPWQVRASRNGDGSLRVTIEGLDEQGHVRFSRTRELFTLAEPGILWSSDSSPTDLAFRRLADLTSRNAISDDESEAIRREVITAHAPADRYPRPSEAWTPLEKNIQRAFANASTPKVRSEGVIPQSAVTITVRGRVQWTDRNGKAHGLPMAVLEIRDDDVVGSQLIQTTATDPAGNYTSTFTYDDGVLQGNPDIFVRVFARSPVADIKPDTSGGSTYRLESPVTNEVAGGSTVTINLTAGNSSDSERAFSVHHALVVIGAYAGMLSGKTPTTIDTRFPTTRSTSMFTGTQLHILRADWSDWDVIHHEYGHNLMAIAGFQQNPGGSHSSDTNLAVTRGSKDIGTRLAWGEGWPTYFGISGQQVMGAAGLGIPDVGDAHYQDSDDANININLETSTGLGEDNEVSVMAALWDLFDGSSDGADAVSMSDGALFTAFRNSGCKTVGGAWDSIAASATPLQRTKLGAVFAQAKIGPELTDPADNVKLTASGPIPTFRWKRNGGGSSNPLNDFKIEFFKSDFSASVFAKDLGDTDHFVPTASEIATILAGGTPVKWVVEGKNTSSPVSPGGTLARYWSGARTLGGVSIAFVIDDTGSMSEEIAGVRVALQSFIDAVAAKVPPGGTRPTIQLVTFKDDVTERITSNDLAAVKTAVGALFASGGGDCPEFSGQALEFAARNIAPGGTILLATDASPQPGVDIGALIASLRAKGVTVNTILSGDCVPTSLASKGSQQSATTIFNSSIIAQGVNKPGDVDPPQPPVVDPGQPPVDDHGDTPSLATLLSVAAEPVRGAVGIEPSDIDYFRLPLTAGTFSIDYSVEIGGPATFEFIDSNATTTLQQATVSDAMPHSFVFVAPGSHDYFLRVTTTSPTMVRYAVAVRSDPFATLGSAVELFSTISAQTGGAFLVRDGVNSGGAAPYQSALYNVMASTLGPVVIAGDPLTLARGTTLSLSLVGLNTNWRSGSSVRVSGDGVDVLSVDTRSATSLTAMVRIAPGATLGFRDVEVDTALGVQTEVAVGAGVIEVGSAVVGPALLSVDPSSLARGDIREVTVHGVNTAWDAASTVALGQGVAVLSKRVISANEIVVQVEVASDAPIGFRSVQVSSGSGSQARERAVFVESAIESLPIVSSLSVVEASANQTLTVTIHGSNTHFVAGLTSASFGSGVDVLSVNVIDALTAQVQVRVAADAAAGFRDVSMTTGGETAVLLHGFFVNAVVAAVPALSGLAFVLLAGLLAAVALVILRR